MPPPFSLKYPNIFVYKHFTPVFYYKITSVNSQEEKLNLKGDFVLVLNISLKDFWNLSTIYIQYVLFYFIELHKYNYTIRKYMNSYIIKEML